MVNLTCRWCETEYSARRSDSKHCGEKNCKRRHLAEWQKLYARKRKAGGKPLGRTTYERECIVCSESFAATSRRQRSCSRFCRDYLNMTSGQTLRASKAGLAVAALVAKEQHPPRNCVGCWVSFTPAAHKQRYCTPGCRSKNRSQRVYYYTCGACQAFHATWNPSQKYCSKYCLNRSKGQAKHRKHAEVVYKRDNWTCWLCGGKTAAAWSDVWNPLAPTLDHVVPKSLGGSNDVENLATAHAICNSKRGNTDNVSFPTVSFT